MEVKLTSYQKLKARVAELEREVHEIVMETPKGLMLKSVYKIGYRIDMQVLTGFGVTKEQGEYITSVMSK